MPRYIFVSKDKPREAKLVECSIAELDKIIEDNKEHWELKPASPAIVSGVYSPKNKPDDWFRDKLKAIKKKTPRSDINTW